jgi:hypothetical protein
MNIQEREELEFTHATAAEVDHFDTILGAANRNDTTSDWLLSDRDVWYPNPYFVGVRGPHPESCHHDEEPENPSEPILSHVYDLVDEDECPF